MVPSEFRALHVFFVNRALSEVSQAELNCLRNVQAGQLQTVAVRIGIIQNRADFLSFAPIRCPSSGARHARKSCAFLVKLRFRCLLKVLLPDAAMYAFSSTRCRGFGTTPVLVASSFRQCAASRKTFGALFQYACNLCRGVLTFSENQTFF